MLAKTTEEYGARIVSSGNGTISSSRQRARWTNVAPGAMIKGDHKTPNPWGYTLQERVDAKGSMNRIYPSNSKLNSNTSGQVFGSGTVPTPRYSLAEAYNQAVARLNDQVRGNLDISVAMAESSSTVRMIRSLTRWRRWFSGFGPKRWANEWLEYTYGWVPLLGDIYNACEEMQRTNDNKLWFEASGKSDLTIGGKVDYNIEGRPFKVQPRLGPSSKCGVRLKVKMTVPRSNEDIARWTSLNPLSIAWELLPYSFVVDWFYDIGGYMRDLETSCRYNSAFAGGFRSNLVAYRVIMEGSYSAVLANSYFDVGSFKLSHKYVQMTRSLLTSYPSPRPPVINTDLSWRRLVSAAALLSQQLGR